MIPEIGIALGVFIIAWATPRVLAGSKRADLFTRSLAAVAGVVALLLTVDLLLRGLDVGSLVSRVRSQPAKTAAAAVTSQDPKQIRSTVTRSGGGTIKTTLGYGIVLSKDSSLDREWIAVHDATLPAKLNGTPGIVTTYKSGSGYSGGEYRYTARNLLLETTEPIQAVEIRFLVFNVWGDHVRTLSFDMIADQVGNSRKDLTGEWQLFSENEAMQHYASIAFIARIRDQRGKVIQADTAAVLEEAQRFSRKFTEADLEPKPVTKG